MDKYKVIRLLRRDEGPKLDFKQCFCIGTDGEKKELTKDVIAMANSRGGRGYIIFGVEDKTKKITGICPEDFKEEQIQQIIYNRCDPPVPISVDMVDIEGKTVAVLTIFRSNHGPHQMLQNGTFYIRRGSTTDIARRNEIANLFQENGLMTYETVLLRNVQIEELDFELVKSFFSSLDVFSDRPNQLLLEALGLIGQRTDGDIYHPTVGGMLLFGKNPCKFLPHVYVKVIYKDQVRIFQGNILSQLENTLEYLMDIIKIKDYPFFALDEVVANALVHRDYLDFSKGITISISQKIIEVSNPGALLAGNSVYKFAKENNPERRNPWLYQRLLTLDPKKRFMKSGLGMSRVKEAFWDIGQVKFINLGSSNLFKVILPL